MEGSGLQRAQGLGQTEPRQWAGVGAERPPPSLAARGQPSPIHQPISHHSSVLPVLRTMSAPHESHLVFLK